MYSLYLLFILFQSGHDLNLASLTCDGCQSDQCIVSIYYSFYSRVGVALILLVLPVMGVSLINV